MRATLLALLLAAGCGRGGPDGVAAFAKKPAMTLPWRHEGRGIDEWLVRLKDGDPAARSEAAQALAALGEDGAAHAADLAPLLGDPNPSVRWSAVDALSRIRPADPALVAAVLRRLADAEPGIRSRVLAAAADLGAGAVPALRAMLSEADERVRSSVLLALSEIGAEAGEAAPEVERALLGDEWDGQSLAATVLAKLGPAGLGALRRALMDPRDEVAAYAADALGSMGADGAPAVEDLAKTLRRKGPPRFAAAHALVALGPPAKAALDAALLDPDAGVRAAVEAALADLPPR